MLSIYTSQRRRAGMETRMRVGIVRRQIFLGPASSYPLPDPLRDSNYPLRYSSYPPIA